MGICRACRRDELVKMNEDDIKEKDDILILKIPYSNTRIDRVFIVNDSQLFVTPIKKYLSLRPLTTASYFYSWKNSIKRHEGWRSLVE